MSAQATRITLWLGLAGMLVGCADAPALTTGNQAPVIGVMAASPRDGLQPGQAIAVTVGATDPEGRAVSFTWAVSGGTLSAEAGPKATWNPPATPGRHNLRVWADDGEGGASAGYLSLDVAPGAVTLGTPVILRPAPATPAPSPTPTGVSSPGPSAAPTATPSPAASAAV